MAGFQAVGTLVAVCTDNEKRPWWIMSSEEVAPIANPLVRYIDALPANIKKRIDQYSMPIALVIGAITVVGEPVRCEMEYARAKRDFINAQRNTRPYQPSAQNGVTGTINQTGNQPYTQSSTNGYQPNTQRTGEFRPDVGSNGNALEDI